MWKDLWVVVCTALIAIALILSAHLAHMANAEREQQLEQDLAAAQAEVQSPCVVVNGVQLNTAFPWCQPTSPRKP